MDYLTALELAHRTLRPSTYVEIGCREGRSLSLARCKSVAIDPDYEIKVQLNAPARIFQEESDRFFAKRKLRKLLGGPVDLAFIDGMHCSENVLRDFINLERSADAASVIVIDDILPGQIEWSTRERQTQAWTGDVYKIIPYLRAHRPDLRVEVFDIKMKGFAVVYGLDPKNRVLSTDQAAREAQLAGPDLAYDTIAELRAALAPRPVEELAPFLDEIAQARRAARLGEFKETPYLDLLKRSLLNEIYLDDELRIAYLRDCLAGKEEFDYAVLHDIRTERAKAYRRLSESRQIGRFPEQQIHRSGFSHTMMGRARLDSLHGCLDYVRRNQVPGDFIECGVWRGGGCIFAAGFFKAHNMRDRKVIVADSFEGLPAPTMAQDANVDLNKEIYPELAVSEKAVRGNFRAYGLLGENVTFLKGWFRDTLHDAPTEQIAVLRMDGDLYESTIDTLNALYDRVTPGGVVIADDYGALKICRDAVADFFDARGEPLPEIHVIDWTGVFWIKPDPAAEVS